MGRGTDESPNSSSSPDATALRRCSEQPPFGQMINVFIGHWPANEGAHVFLQSVGSDLFNRIFILNIVYSMAMPSR